uniref:BrnT family toxin n=1 Tax=Desulfobacca acetoxidans TaxID=60893 RepID=A0A7V4G6V7_9BACT
MKYQWDPEKARANVKKHRVEFADAVGVFEDPRAITLEDPDPEGEQRFVSIGMDFLGRIIVVVYTYRGEALRLISARKATKKEVSMYEKRI